MNLGLPWEWPTFAILGALVLAGVVMYLFRG